MNPLEWAKKYTQLGFSVIPAGLNKAPLVKKWTEYADRTPTPKELENWFEGKTFDDVALFLPIKDDFIVIDFDEPKLKPLFFDVWPDTFIVKTRRGFHVYFKVKKGTAKTVEWRGYIELKSKGRGVVAYPSKIKVDGKEYQYEIEKGDISRIKELTDEELDELIFRIKTLNKFSSLIEKLVNLWSEGVRHELSMSVSLLLRNYGVSEKEAIIVIGAIGLLTNDDELVKDRIRVVKDAYDPKKGYKFSIQKAKEALGLTEKELAELIDLIPKDITSVPVSPHLYQMNSFSLDNLIEINNELRKTGFNGFEIPLDEPPKKIVLMDYENKITWLYNYGFNSDNEPILRSKKILMRGVFNVKKEYHPIEPGENTFAEVILEKDNGKYRIIGNYDDFISALQKKLLLIKSMDGKENIISNVFAELINLAEDDKYVPKLGVYFYDGKLSVVTPKTTEIALIPVSQAQRDILNDIRRSIKIAESFEEAKDIINTRLKESTIRPSILSTLLCHAIACPLIFAILDIVPIIPHVVCFGEKGTGKTTACQLFSNIYGLSPVETGTVRKSEYFMHIMGLVRGMPVMVDELEGITDLLYSLLKQSATTDTIHGRLTKSGEVREKFSLRAPVVCTTNDVSIFLSDDAMAKRYIYLDFSGQKTSPKYIQKLKEKAKPVAVGYSILEEIVKRYTREELEKKFNEKKDYVIEKLCITEPRDVDIAAMLLFARDLLEELGINVSPEEDIVAILKQSFELSNITYNKLFVEEFMEYVETYCPYYEKEGCYIVILSDIENFVKEHQDFAKIDILPKTKRQWLSWVAGMLNSAGRRCKVVAMDRTSSTSLTVKKGDEKVPLKVRSHLRIYKEIKTQESLGNEDVDTVKKLILTMAKQGWTLDDVRKSLNLPDRVIDEALTQLQGDGDIRIDGKKIIVREIVEGGDKS